jgi:hypothetical protein
MMLKAHSIWLSQEACFGVKCRDQRGWSSNQSDVVGVVRRQVVANEVAAPFGMAHVGQVQQFDKGVGVVVLTSGSVFVPRFGRGNRPVGARLSGGTGQAWVRIDNSNSICHPKRRHVHAVYYPTTRWIKLASTRHDVAFWPFGKLRRASDDPEGMNASWVRQQRSE